MLSMISTGFVWLLSRLVTEAIGAPVTISTSDALEEANVGLQVGVVTCGGTVTSTKATAISQVESNPPSCQRSKETRSIGVLTELGGLDLELVDPGLEPGDLLLRRLITRS
jgi:hypothetical protein